MSVQCSIRGLRDCAHIFSQKADPALVVNDLAPPEAEHRVLTIPSSLFIPDLTDGAVDEQGRPTKGLIISLCADQKSICEMLEKGEQINIFLRPRVLVDRVTMRWADDNAPNPLIQDEIYSFGIPSDDLRNIVYHSNPAIMLLQVTKRVLAGRHAEILIDSQRAEQDRHIALLNRLHESDVVSLDFARKSDEQEPYRKALGIIQSHKGQPTVNRTLTLTL